MKFYMFIVSSYFTRRVERGKRRWLFISLWLRYQAVRLKTVALIDLDPQASAAKWSRYSRSDDDTDCHLRPCHSRFQQVLHTAEQQAVLTLCDYRHSHLTPIQMTLRMPSRVANFDADSESEMPAMFDLAGNRHQRSSIGKIGQMYRCGYIVFNAVNDAQQYGATKPSVRLRCMVTQRAAPCVLGDLCSVFPRGQ